VWCKRFPLLLHKTRKNLQKPKTINQFLEYIKLNGPQSAGSLAKVFDITVEGARLHLSKLAAEELIQPESNNSGQGRPSLIYKLTGKGHNKFADSHQELTIQILNKVEAVLGKNALHAIINARAMETDKRYSNELEGTVTPEEKLNKLAELRSGEGYMAEWKKEGSEFLFIENHCPIGTAASHCQGFCNAELNTLRSVLGNEFEVERIEHLPEGGRRCCYRIKINN